MGTDIRTAYKRALLKISGEALSGDRKKGIDPEKTRWIADQITQVISAGCRVGVVIGGGNIIRGAEAEEVGVPPLVGDQMGMTATVINALALSSVLESKGARSMVMSAFEVGNFVERFNGARAIEGLESGKVLVFAGGTGNPCFTTDSAAALRAVEIDADIMIKATQVDGIYSDNPRTNPDAVFYETITPGQVLEERLRIVDAAAVEILGRKSIPMMVLNLHKEGNLLKAVTGERVGSIMK
jgi:uridylate kinase